MAITAERLEVDVEANTKGAKRDLDQFDRSIQGTVKSTGRAAGSASKMGGAFRMASGLVKAAAGTMVAAIGTQTVMAASDLNEVMSKTGVVFGPQAQIVTDAAQQMADQFGISKTTFLDAASGIGLVGKASGQTQKEAARMSSEMAKLAADAASFYNVPVTEALDAMKSGLVGESEPMRRFGVLLSEAAVQNEAYRLGIAKTGDELTEAQKVQARSSLIMKGMKDASGDLARTQDSVANRLREMQGRVTNFAADLGTKALPAVEWFLGAVIKAPQVLSKAAGSVRDYISTNKTFRPVLEAVKAAVDVFLAGVQRAPEVLRAVVQAVKDFIREHQWIKPILDQAALAVGAFVTAFLAVLAVQKVVAVIKAITLAVKGLMLAMAANPVALVIASLVALGLVLYAAYQRFEGFRNLVNTVAAALKNGFGAAVDWVKAKWAEWAPQIMAGITQVRGYVQAFLAWIGPVWKAYFSALVNVAKVVWNTIKGVIQGALQIIKGVINVVMGAIKGDWGRVWQGIKQVLSGAWKVITSLVSGAIGVVKAAIVGGIGVMKAAWSAGWQLIKAVVSRAWDAMVNAVKSGVGKVVEWVKGLPGKAKAALGNLGGLLRDAGVQIITGLWDGLKAKWEDVKSWFGSITDAIPNLKGPRAKDRRLLIENGQAIMQGLKEGLLHEWADVRRFLKGVTKWVENDAIPDKVGKALERRLEKVGKRVKRLIQRNTRLAEKMEKAVQAHADAVQAKEDFRSTTHQGMFAQANVMNAGNNGATIAASLAAQVTKVQQYAANLAALQARGLNADAISQITAAGVDGGSQVAAALAAATDAELASINASYAAIGATATQTADTLSGQLFDAGIQTAQGVIDGIQQKQDQIKSTLRTIAQSMLGEVRELVRDAIKQEKAAEAAQKAKQETAKATKDAAEGKGPSGDGKGPRKPRTPKNTGNDRDRGRASFKIDVHNPVAEPTSRSTNKALNRAASLGLV